MQSFLLLCLALGLFWEGRIVSGGGTPAWSFAFPALLIVLVVMPSFVMFFFFYPNSAERYQNFRSDFSKMKSLPEQTKFLNLR